MSNSSNPTPTLSNTAEIVENESRFKLSPLPSNKNMTNYKDSDKFKRTSKATDPKKHTDAHITRWEWIGEDGKTYSQINAPDSDYRKTLEGTDRSYTGNDSKIDHHLTYDIQTRGMIKKVQKNKEELIFGHIEGVQVGQIFESRKELSKFGLHAPTMAGIWGRENEGSCSIVLSGGYEDDIDNLDYILYTGQGGQDDRGKQVSDQEFSRGNKGLQLSCEYGLPVRVTRGHQIQNGPESGYRYDGLYYVTSYERIIGKSGHYICRFHLESELSISDLEKKLDENLPENYKTAHRTETTINKINRNIKLREKIKEIYSHKCQICNVYLRKPHGAIAIGAHIKGLGQPHNGPDTLGNMLCLCPNHHDQFDALAFYIDPETFIIKGLEGYEEVKLTISKNHKIDKQFLEYHKDQYEKKNSEN